MPQGNTGVKMTAGKPSEAKPKPQTKSLPSTSIHSLLKSAGNSANSNQKVVDQEEADVVQDSGTNRRENFELNDLQKYWVLFAAPFEKENPRLFSMLKGHQPRIKENHVVVFPLNNETQESELLKVKSGLLRYLRDSLKNDSIVLEVEYIMEEKEEKYIFTNNDRLRVLIEKNPVLEKLKETLRLDLE